MTPPAPAALARFRHEASKAEYGIDHAYAALLGLRTFDAPGLHDRAEEGLSWAALERLRRVMDVPLSAIAEYLAIAPRTLARRQSDGRLRPDESDRLLRLAKTVGLAIQLFEGDTEEARDWLLRENLLLGGRAPVTFAATDVGAREVEDLIGRLEHGVVA